MVTLVVSAKHEVFWQTWIFKTVYRICYGSVNFRYFSVVIAFPQCRFILFRLLNSAPVVGYEYRQVRYFWDIDIKRNDWKPCDPYICICLPFYSLGFSIIAYNVGFFKHIRSQTYRCRIRFTAPLPLRYTLHTIAKLNERGR